MDLKQLEYFVRVAELGSFTRASIALDIAQPALSRQVRQLETELGQNLLIRTGRGVVTTEAGKILLEHSLGVLRQLERAREELGRVRGGLAGRVALGMPPSLSKVLGLPLAQAFHQALPSAMLSISEGLSVAMQERLINGQLDLILLYNATPSADIDLHPLATQPLYLVQIRDSSDEPQAIALAEAVEQPLVMPSRPNAIRMLVETELANLGLRPRIAMEVDAVPVILDLVADGIGSGILPASTIQAFGQADTFQMRPIVDPPLLTRLYWAVSSRRPTTAIQRNLIELIRTKVGELISGVS